MAQLPSPVRPLKILTLDGGGLQAISTLLILDKLLDTVAQNNGVSLNKPRPCDVFDTIAGIGAGGWLALLLGRFRMDIPTCLSEWYKITQCIAPRSKSEEVRNRLFRHCYYDPARLVEQIELLTKVYGTGSNLLESDRDDARTRHVFVAALRSDAKGYGLFRTYEIPPWAKSPEKLLEGPQNPDAFKVSHAFAVTGAAKYFTPPWEALMAESGKIRFSDCKFPEPHNITRLALNEMWAIYGTNVPLSVVVNIGPGLPNDSDAKLIARRFSWGTVPVYAPITQRQEPLPAESGKPSTGSPSGSPAELKPEGFSNESHSDPSRQDPVSAPVGGKRSKSRFNSFGSTDEDFGIKLMKLESEVEENIRTKLNRVYPDVADLYYRLSPERAPRGTARNDSLVSGLAFDAALRHLDQDHVKTIINTVAQRIPEIRPIPEISVTS